MQNEVGPETWIKKNLTRRSRLFVTSKMARDQLWGRARNLLEAGFEVEAYILILATWNFARFRYFMKSFDLREFQKVIKEVNPVFKRLANKQFQNVDFADRALLADIRFIFKRFRQIAEQTGASKLMALKHPSLLCGILK